MTFWYDITDPVVGINVITSPADDLDEVKGSASDATSPINITQVRVQRDSDSYYLNLHGGIWQECEVWNDAVAQDGTFDEKIDPWKLDVSGVEWNDGVTYTFTAMTTGSLNLFREATPSAPCLSDP